MIEKYLSYKYYYHLHCKWTLFVFIFMKKSLYTLMIEKYYIIFINIMSNIHHVV